MPARLLLSSLTPALQRRLARTPLRRRNFEPLYRPLTTTSLLRNSNTIATEDENLQRASEPGTSQVPDGITSPVVLSSKLAPLVQYVQPGNLDASSIPHSSALSALLSRLSLPIDRNLHPILIACLTNPSYNPPTRTDSEGRSIPAEIPDNNELLSHLGNSLLGLFASEHLAVRYPLLPTEALKAAVTAYVGVDACVGVARELGVGVQGGGNAGYVGKGRGSPSAGIPVRWSSVRRSLPKTPVAKRFAKYEENQDDSAEGKMEQKAAEKVKADAKDNKANQRETFEKAVAASVRAFIGLIYQEQGIHAARAFTHAHFLTRHLDLAALFSFKNPKTLLKSVVTRHLAQSGVRGDSGEAWIESRMLAQTGVHSQAPIFNVGLFLKSGIKLAEGHGSSIKMAEHRAATNALLSFFLVRGDQGNKAGSIPSTQPGVLPSAAHSDFPVDQRGVSWIGVDHYEGTGFGGMESLEESSRRKQYEGRLKGARRTNAQ